MYTASRSDTLRFQKTRKMLPTRDGIHRLSLLLNVLLAAALFLLGFQRNEPTLRGTSCVSGKEITFHGGHPEAKRTGTCWCGHEDHYCMCTPNLAIDLVIVSGQDFVLVRRKDTNQLAVMGGFVNVGETVEHAVARELQEEMGIQLQQQLLRLLGIYSDPRRDNRRHTVSAAFVIQVPKNIRPRAADDVKDVQRIPFSEMEEHTYFADHKTILSDYLQSMGGESKEIQDVFENVVRSTC